MAGAILSLPLQLNHALVDGCSITVHLLSVCRCQHLLVVRVSLVVQLVHGASVVLCARPRLLACARISVAHVTRLIEHALLVSGILGRHVHRLSATHLGRLRRAKEATRAHGSRSLLLLLRLDLHACQLLFSLHDLSLILANLALQVD